MTDSRSRPLLWATRTAAMLVGACGTAHAGAFPISTLLVSADTPPLPSALMNLDVIQSTARINQAGEMVIWADLSPDGMSPSTGRAVWRGAIGAPPSSFELLYDSAMSAPDTPVPLTTGFPQPIPQGFNSSGDVSVRLQLHGTSGPYATPDAVYIFEAGGPRLIALQGQQVPGMAPDIIFGAPNDTTLDGLGRVGWNGAIAGPGVTLDNNSIAWLATDTGLLSVARESEQAEGLPVGTVYTGSIFPTPLSGGQVVLSAVLAGLDVDSTNDRALLIGAPGALTPLFREGQSAPGLAGQQFIRSRSTKYADDGRALIRAEFGSGGVAGGEGLWSGYAGALQLVAATGEPAAGMGDGETYGSIADWASMSESGLLALTGTVTGPTVGATNDEAVWGGAADALSLIAREGDQVPGLGPGVEFDTFVGATGQAARNLVINTGGVFAFWSGLRGDNVDASNDEAVWVGRLGAGLEPLLRSGDLYEVAPGDERTIERFLPRGSGQGSIDGEWITLSDSGQLIVELEFTDGSAAQLIAIVPAPGCALAMLGCSGGAAARRRR